VRPSRVLRRAADYLERHEVDSPLPTAEQLLASVLGTDRAGLYSRDEALRADEAKAFGRVLCRRCAGEPTQHLTGEAGFRSIRLIVRRGVFVPRPETECLVEAALEVVVARPSPLIVDVGTGTGAIALALKHERPDARVWAVDRSPDAIALAKENATALGLEIEVRPGDLLSDLDPGIGPVDLVVSNPPYVAPGEFAELPREVRADPAQALLGGPEVYEAIFAQASPRLRAGGSVVVEIDERRAEAVSRAARAAGASETMVRRDLAGRDRVVVATWP
jgi:release factor glutamine methyltransferase